MSTEARRRLMRDFKKLKESKETSGITAAPQEDNIMNWEAVIFGPDETIWEGEFSEDYPNKAPMVRFENSIFHPNVYSDGKICLDILQNQWSPIYDISAILTSIQSLLCDPNPNSPANGDAAQLFQNDRKEYIRRVKEVVELSWNEQS